MPPTPRTNQRQPAAELVRIEVQTTGEGFAQEIRTDQFLKTAGAWRSGDQYILGIGKVRAFIPRGTIIQLLQQILATMPDEDKMEIIEPSLEPLERHGFLKRR